MKLSQRDQELILEALRKFSKGQATEEEILFVNQWFRYAETQPDILDSMTGEARDLLEKEMHQQIAKDIRAPRLPIVRSDQSLGRRWRYAAAAVVILAGGITGLYAIFHGSKRMDLAQTGVRHLPADKIEPGSTRAILQLGDGAEIQLDSVQNGVLSKQGSTQIIKVQAGNLVYQTGTSNNDQVSFNTIIVPRGGYYNVTLPDGTKVWLNAASSLRFPTSFSGNSREVELRGEAYFEIASNKKMPFSVAINQTSVQVLGTHFNVNGYDDEGSIRTTLLEGAVKFRYGSDEKLIRPGQEIIYSKQTHSAAVQQADTNQVMGWKNGFFEFDNLELPAIMRLISRWYNVDVSYHSTRQIELTGSLSRKSKLEEVLQLLEKNGVHVTVNDRTIIIN
jgi:ferric-dicitrate binding protein FerR (iron transport regulator)